MMRTSRVRDNNTTGLLSQRKFLDSLAFLAWDAVNLWDASCAPEAWVKDGKTNSP